MSILVENAEALALEVSCTRDALSVVLTDGRTVSVHFNRAANPACSK